MFRQRSGGDCFRVLPHPLPFGLKKKKKVFPVQPSCRKAHHVPRDLIHQGEGTQASFDPQGATTEEGLRARVVNGLSLWCFLPCYPKVVGFCSVPRAVCGQMGNAMNQKRHGG